MITLPDYENWSSQLSWCVNLWLANEEEPYRYWTSRAEDLLEEAQDDATEKPTAEEVKAAVADLADELREHFEQNQPELSGPFGDLLGIALAYVDWREIAEAWIQTACEAR